MRRARHRAIAAGGVALLAASIRLVGCGSSGCVLDGFCCCDGETSVPVACGITGATCASGVRLARGADCAATCRSGGDAQSDDADASDASDAPIDACGAAAANACCCQSNLVGELVCGEGGALSCAAGYGLYQGDDCRCLPDRDTPCCLPHVHADASSEADSD